jgi:hypothetical protein
MRTGLPVKISLDLYESAFSATARRRFADAEALSRISAIAFGLWLLTGLTFAGLNQLGVDLGSDVQFWVLAPLLALLALVVLTPISKVSAEAACVLGLVAAGAITREVPTHLALVPTIAYLIPVTALLSIAALRFGHHVIGRIVPVACPRCGKLLRHESKRWWTEERGQVGKWVEDNVRCRSCGFNTSWSSVSYGE